MHITEKQVCDELFRDLVCYEMCRGRLSPEMKHLLETHLDHCPACRCRILDFMRMIKGSTIVRNFG